MRTLSRYLPHFSVDGALRPPTFDGAAQKLHAGSETTLHAAPQPQAPSFSQEEVSLAVSQAVRDATAKMKAELAASEAARREDEERFAATLTERLATARAEWTEAEADRLASGMGAAFAALETRISDVLARILMPFVGEAMRRRAIDEATQAIGGLLSQPLPAESAPPAITVRGPEDLLAALKERLGEPAGVVFTVAPGVEIEASCADTLIETRLGAWTDLLTATQKDGPEAGGAHGG